MNITKRMVAAAILLILLLPACGRTADSSVAPPARQAVPAAKADRELPEENGVEALVGQANFDFPGDSVDAPVSVADRILDGFQAAPGQLRLDDGSVIYWGFKYKEAYFRSIAVYDAQGQLRLVGAVDNIVWLTIDYRSPIATAEEYEKARQESRLGDASLTLFVGDAGDLPRYLPVVKRWLQASLLGFIGDCNAARLEPSCKFAADLQLPVSAHLVAGGDPATLSPLSVPDVPAASVPINQFMQ